MTEREKKIELDVFLCDLHVVVTENPKASFDARGLHRSLGEFPDELNDSNGFVFSKGRSDYYVFLPPRTGFGTIAHEAVHVIGRIFRDRGVQADYENDEIFAYFVGWIVGIMAEEIEKASHSFPHENDTES
jgi:hypothetical protein